MAAQVHADHPVVGRQVAGQPAPVVAVAPPPVDDGEIFYTEHGDGPAVLLVHGWGCDGNDWSWLASDLSADHR
ncbi:alpha/beta hydrolase, partial [Mycobacterium sp. ITM-2017-0098]